jgi:tetratricopeptide (TPR) repeat protein
MTIGDAKGAAAEFRRAIELRLLNPEVHNNLGVALAAQGKVDEALSELRQALRLRPEYAEAHYNLGLAELKKGDAHSAGAEFREALQLKPDYIEARQHLGSVLMAWLKRLRQVGAELAVLDSTNREASRGNNGRGRDRPRERPRARVSRFSRMEFLARDLRRRCRTAVGELGNLGSKKVWTSSVVEEPVQ